MTGNEKKPPKQMPKGGRKGGTVFPRVSLNDALQYARKLVSKTHTSPQAKEVILTGVLGNKSGVGNVRMSALKQYGFLIGDAKNGFAAHELAKRIAAAPEEELAPLYQQAILRPTVFKKLFETFHGDAVTKAKLKQRAADLKVHPDETESCVGVYISGMVTAGLVTVDGDRIFHKASSDVGKSPVSVDDLDPSEDDSSDPLSDEKLADNEPKNANKSTFKDGLTDDASETRPLDTASLSNSNGPRAVFNVNVTLDSSLDIEKLQRQLELLKRFGAI